MITAVRFLHLSTQPREEPVTPTTLSPDPAFRSLCEKACELDALTFVHGYNQSVTWGKDAAKDPYDTTSIVGMNSDETLFFWHLINGGVLDVRPALARRTGPRRKDSPSGGGEALRVRGQDGVRVRVHVDGVAHG